MNAQHPPPPLEGRASLFETLEQGDQVIESNLHTKDVASLFETLQHGAETTKGRTNNACDPTIPLVVAGMSTLEQGGIQLLAAKTQARLVANVYQTQWSGILQV